MRHRELREEIVRVARSMNERGLNQGTSGNVSARVAEGLLITPSGVAYETMGAEAIVLIDPEGAVLEDGAGSGGGGDAPPVTGSAAVGPSPDGRPSTEWRLHAAVLRSRPEVGAVVHTHSMFSTTLACLRRDIPPFHYMVAVAGGDTIPCAGYATFGTPELAANAVEALRGRMACLLANHGMVALGPTPVVALDLALEVETLAAMYWRALQVAEPAVLSEAEMRDVERAFRDYRSG